jgi:hypothetical protein
MTPYIQNNMEGVKVLSYGRPRHAGAAGSQKQGRRLAGLYPTQPCVYTPIFNCQAGAWFS